MKIGGTKPDACLPPRAPRPPRRIVVPKAAWDCHAHVIGRPPEHRWTSPRNYDPPAATIEDYIDLLDTLSLAFGVLVQVSVHGTDNSALVAGLRAHPDRLRGVAAVTPDVDDRTLEQLHQAGVRGARIMTVTAGGVSLDAAKTLASRIGPLGWHLEFALHGAELQGAMPHLLELSVPFVIAHFGDCDAESGPGGAQFQALAHLVRNADCHVKLSAAYRLSPAPWTKVGPLAAALIDLAPDRLLWGSDWPHVAITDPDAMPPTEALLDLLAEWSADEEVQRRILVDNPRRLYGTPVGTR
jgi:2-pyrone-4,6-dicarboxylate lactonase